LGSAGDGISLLSFTNLKISAIYTILKLTVLGETAPQYVQTENWVILARIVSIFSSKCDEKNWHQSGLLGAEMFFPLFSGNVASLKAVLDLTVVTV